MVNPQPKGITMDLILAILYVALGIIATAVYYESKISKSDSQCEAIQRENTKLRKQLLKK